MSMEKLNSWIITKKPFMVDTEELSVLELMSKIGTKTNELIDFTTKLNLEKLDITGDFKGTWHGLVPTKANEMVSAVLELHDKLLNDIRINVDNKTTQEIQQLINVKAKKGVIYFPNTLTNEYVFTDTLLIPSFTRIIVEKDVVLKLNNGVNKPLFKGIDNETHDVFISGGIFDINPNGQTIQTPVIDFNNIHNSVFLNCKVRESKFVGYKAEGAFNLLNANGCKIINCEVFKSGSEGLYITGTNNLISGGEYSFNSNGSGVAIAEGSRNIIKNVYSHDNTGSNIVVDCTRNIIAKCISTNSKGNNGITLGHVGRPADGTIVTQNIVENNNDGIRVLAKTVKVNISKNYVSNNKRIDGSINSIGIGVSDGSSDCIITSNHVELCGTGISVSSDNIVGNNKVELCSANGLVITGSRNNVAVNTCLNNGQDSVNGSGIYCSGSFNNISKNICCDTQITPTQFRGIYSDGTRNNISDNTCLNNKNGNLVASSPNNLSNNILSETDSMSFDVALVATTTQAINNQNITPQSKITILPLDSAYYDRKPFITNILNGVINLTMSPGSGGNIRIIIN